jgi:hypothetical protein
MADRHFWNQDINWWATSVNSKYHPSWLFILIWQVKACLSVKQCTASFLDVLFAHSPLTQTILALPPTHLSCWFCTAWGNLSPQWALGLGYQHTHLENYWRRSILIISTVLISLILVTLFSPFASTHEDRHFCCSSLIYAWYLMCHLGFFLFFPFYLYFRKDSYYFGFIYKAPEFHSYLTHL